MQENILLKIFDDNFTTYGEQLLSILLKDRTTGKNIIWATNDYVQLNETYKAKNEMNLDIITGGNERFIRPRVTKSYKKQNHRTRDKAEVFTPSWMCNKQNNLVDEQWFGRENVFNISKDKTWIPNNEKIIFPTVDGQNWKDYVDANRMEITCGEAPYLVSRYDTVTGEAISLNSRIGLLDRKIRVVGENTESEEEWLKWIERAFQSIYGYELQGDNLLLARENLLYTFIDNLRDKLKREPSLNELKRIATIISWNIWQMDGLTYSIPFSELKEKSEQLSLFKSPKDLKENSEDKYCKIKDWKSNTVLEFRSLLEESKNG